MTSKIYHPPVTITRDEFLVAGSDAGFRHSIYAMVQSVSRLLACRDAFGRELDLTPSQFAVLMGVAHTQGSGGVTIRELSEHVALASTHVTTEVGRLERAGFLIKRPSNIDRRSVSVSLLPRAKAEIARIAPFIRLVNDALFHGIDAKSLRVAHEVARQLILNSETALAEIRRHDLEKTAATMAVAKGPAASTGPATKELYQVASRLSDRNDRGNGSRRKRAAVKRRSG